MKPRPISSASNPTYRAALKLRTGRGRKRLDRILIDGDREISRALAAGVLVEGIFTSPGNWTTAMAHHLGLRSEAPIPIWELTESLFARLAYGERGEGLVAVAHRPDVSLEKMVLGPAALIVVVESAEKPGNVGAIARSADASGATGIILASPKCDLFHPNAIRASLGCVFHLPAAVGSSEGVRGWLEKNRIAAVCAQPLSRQRYTDFDFTGPTAIVVGSEAGGLSDAWTGTGVTEVSLPMRGVADSLNVSVAAAVLLFEAARQRDLHIRPENV